MSQNNNNNKNDIEQLYRLYQEKRDNTPSTLLWELLNTAKTKNHAKVLEKQENQISAILQAAKIAPSEIGIKNKPTSSITGKLNTIWQSLFSTSFGGTQWAAISAVLVIMLAINLIPSPQTSDPYLEIAYLDDCNICDHLAISSTTKLRNIDLNPNKITSSKSTARFGRLVLDLELTNHLANTDVDKRNRALLNTIKNLAVQENHLALKEYFNQFDATHIFSMQEVTQAIQFFNQTFKNQIDNDLYHAGQWFERLRITNESALASQNFSSIHKALSDIDVLRDKLKSNQRLTPSILSGINQLTQFKQSNNVDTQQAQQISMIIKKILISLDM